MKTEFIEYHDGHTTLEAFVAHVESDTHKPVVLIAHAWAGRDQFVCDKAKLLAEMGYVGFALDVYGKGKLGSNNEENSALMTPFMENRENLRRRLLAGFETATQLPYVDETKVAAIGYCFGGLCALDLARSGADLKGVVSFHGLLSRPPLSETITAKVLALHGDADPMVSPENVRSFQEEMTQANVDWQMHIYGNTMHAFTNPEANDADFGTVYNQTAAKRSWQAMTNFLAEIF